MGTTKVRLSSGTPSKGRNATYIDVIMENQICGYGKVEHDIKR